MSEPGRQDKVLVRWCQWTAAGRSDGGRPLSTVAAAAVTAALNEQLREVVISPYRLLPTTIGGQSTRRWTVMPSDWPWLARCWQRRNQDCRDQETR